MDRAIATWSLKTINRGPEVVWTKLALIPEENIKDLTDIPDNVKNAIEIVPVRWIDKVLELALEKMPEPLPELTPEEIAKAAEASKTAQAATGEVLKHWARQ